MTTLKSLLVVPQFDGAAMTGATLTRYLDRNGYRRTLTTAASSLLPDVLGAFTAVVANAQALRAADERIAQVYGELAGQAPDQSHTATEPATDPDTGQTVQREITVVDTWRPVISLALTLRKLDGCGERTVPVTTEQLTPEARAAVLTLWQLLAA